VKHGPIAPLFRGLVMSTPRYFAYHVDLDGVARASYELNANEDERAKAEARYFLKFHPTIEIWQDARWIARFVREERTRRH
jgi:hypothetical protein